MYLHKISSQSFSVSLLCFIYIKNFRFQMYVSPWLNNVAQGWTGLPCSSIICSMDLTLSGCAIVNMNIVLSSVVKRCIWASREVIICYLPVRTASYGTSWVDFGVLAALAGWQLKDWWKVQRDPFLSLVDTVLTYICHDMFVYVLHNLGGLGLVFLTHFSQFT